MTKVLLNTIDLNAPTQLREMKESQHHVRDLAYVYADNGEFLELPWVGMIKGSKILVPIDGFHRLRAVAYLSSDEFNKIEDAPNVSHLDLEVVNVKVTQFDNMGEAIIAAAGVNATHGMKRKSGDIATAIAAIIKVEKMMFMENNYKLNKRVIMRTVNCSTTSYNRETKDLRSNLLKQRNFDMRGLYADGMSQRDIAACVGVDHKTVSNILGGEFEPMVEIPQAYESEQFEPLVETAQQDGSEGFEPLVEIPQEDNVVQENGPMGQIPEEESSSIFRHVTSVVPIENPWKVMKRSSPTKVANTPKHGQRGVMTDLELSQLVNSLSAAQRVFLKSCLA
jgi:transcriptional regulator with XRE-family HTH domain